MSLAAFDAPHAAPSLIRHDWTREEIRALFALPFPELIFRAQQVHRSAFRSDRSADLDPAVDQDRRLPGGLRLLPAGRAIQHRRQGREADVARRRAARSAGGEGRRRVALLHGRGVALAEGSRPRQGLRHGRGREGARPRDLRHARHADRRAGAAAQIVGARLLQPQPRHLAGILRRHHHHAHLSGPARHARPCARRRHPCLLRRHCRHGRGPGRSRRHDRDARRRCRCIRSRCRSTCW